MKYPFKFLDSYTKSDSDIFFGRTEEIESLYEMMFQTDILLLYGASGTGKTSLIQCGLASKFESHDWLAINIRRGANINASLEKALSDAGGKVNSQDLAWLDELNVEAIEYADEVLTPLQQYFKAIFRTFFKPIYLVFDQFEELYILGSKDEQEKFIQTVKAILQIKQPVKLIFSIREEYLGFLHDFEKEVPQLLRKKLRVESMNLEKVHKVIQGVSLHKYTNVRVDAAEASKITEGIFHKIKGKEKTLTIQLPYLQVFLDKLYLDITKDETRQKEAVFTLQALDNIGDIGDVLRNFLEEQARIISGNLSKKHSSVTLETIWKILSPFATLEGTKEPIYKKDLQERLPGIDVALIDDTIESFVNSRILRYSQDEDIYEIAHDSLALRIAEKRTDDEIAVLEVRRMIKNQVAIKESAREVFTEKQLDFIQPYLAKLALSNDEKKLINESFLKQEDKRRRRVFIRWAIASSAVAVLVLTIVLSLWALRERERALEALEKNKREQAISKANQFKAFGDSYVDLNKFDFASQSYQAGLDTLKNYRDENLFVELSQKLEQCKNKK